MCAHTHVRDDDIRFQNIVTHNTYSMSGSGVKVAASFQKKKKNSHTHTRKTIISNPFFNYYTSHTITFGCISGTIMILWLTLLNNRTSNNAIRVEKYVLLLLLYVGSSMCTKRMNAASGPARRMIAFYNDFRLYIINKYQK